MVYEHTHIFHRLYDSFYKNDLILVLYYSSREIYRILHYTANTKRFSATMELHTRFYHGTFGAQSSVTEFIIRCGIWANLTSIEISVLTRHWQRIGVFRISITGSTPLPPRLYILYDPFEFPDTSMKQRQSVLIEVHASTVKYRGGKFGSKRKCKTMNI